MSKTQPITVAAPLGCIIDRVPFSQGDRLGEVDEAGRIVAVAEGITRGHVEARLNAGVAQIGEVERAAKPAAPEKPVAARRKDLEAKTVEQLRQIARDHSIDLAANAAKAKIVDAILAAEAPK